jgi:hypothetical protein
MALQGLKHGSFKNDYWELPKETVFLLEGGERERVIVAVGT